MSDITIAIAVEDLTTTFQLGDTVAEAISQTVPTLPAHNDGQVTDECNITVITNSTYLKGWCTHNGYDAKLTNDNGLIEAIAHDTVTIAILVPAIETLGINPGTGIALVAPDDHVLNRVQDELLRLNEDGTRVHDESWIALVLPPEYRMVRSTSDPDTYVRAIANPNYVNIEPNNNSDENA